MASHAGLLARMSFWGSFEPLLKCVSQLCTVINTSCPGTRGTVKSIFFVESFWGRGHLLQYLVKRRRSVGHSEESSCLTEEPQESPQLDIPSFLG